MFLCRVTVQCKFPKIAASSSSEILHCLPWAIQRTLSYCKLRLYPPQVPLLCQQWLSWCCLSIPEGLGSTYAFLRHAFNSEYISPPKGLLWPCWLHLQRIFRFPAIPTWFQLHSNYTALACLKKYCFSFSTSAAVNISTLGLSFFPLVMRKFSCYISSPECRSINWVWIFRIWSLEYHCWTLCFSYKCFETATFILNWT